jgi:two-component system NtrC family sensor kinase
MERRMLALDALSNLTRQFCDKPDFERLIDVLLMTICGQLSVADSFALLRKFGAQSLTQSFFATGKLRRNMMLASLQVSADEAGSLLTMRSVCRIEDLLASEQPSELIPILSKCGVSLVGPLMHNDKFFGIIGLGDRVTGKPYGQDELDLLNTIINTVTPLVANSYLFWEIASLNAWYLDILNSVKQGVFVFDRDYRLRKVNRAGLAIIRTFNPEASGINSLIDQAIGNVFPENTFGGWAREIVLSRALRRNKALTSVAGRSDGAERIYNVSITGTVENAEIGTALIVTLDDVTVQKESEQRLFDLQKFADKGLMASSIAHELNNFLALILGGVEIMQIAMAKGDMTKVDSTLGKLRVHVGNMERFTGGLTDYARLESNKEARDLNSIIGDVLSFLSVQKRFKQIKIVSELDSQLPGFRMDADQIAQLLLNLLNNAADAISESGRDDGQIVIGTGCEAGKAVLTVSDNGIGIKVEAKTKIFKERVTTKQKGHGYGLVTCAKIVENHSGVIETESTEGMGTIFIIRLPITPPSE